MARAGQRERGKAVDHAEDQELDDRHEGPFEVDRGHVHASEWAFEAEHNGTKRNLYPTIGGGGLELGLVVRAAHGVQHSGHDLHAGAEAATRGRCAGTRMGVTVSFQLVLLKALPVYNVFTKFQNRV